MESKRIVVTGLGTINPIGNNVREFLQSLQNGVSGAAPITRFDASHFKTQFACEVKNYDPLDHFDRKEVRRLDIYSQFALISAKEAIIDANLNAEEINKNDVGVISGTGIGGLATFNEETIKYIEGDKTPRFSPFFIPKMIANIAGGHISINYGFKGINYTTVAACASSAYAIIDALNYIRMGKSKAFVVGGSEAAITEAGVGGFNAMKALSTRNDSPKTASRPFDKGRDGFVIGEGSATLVIEEYEHAKKRGAKIYAEITGGGINNDAYHITSPHPEGHGASAVIALALKDASLDPLDVDYINVHGTSTGVGDVPEVNAIKRVFGNNVKNVSISSTKSMTGHLLGAAGTLEALASILAINNNFIPPTINHFERDPGIDENLDIVFNKVKSKKVNTVLSNTFGFGGHNACIAIKSM